MEEVLEEKARFISDNKDIFINNLGMIGYELFVILESDLKLSNIKEYEKVIECIEKNKNINSVDNKDESAIIYSLTSYIDRTCFDINTKEKYKNNMFRYLTFFKKDNKKRIKSEIGTIFA